MSQQLYIKLWEKTQADLNKIVQIERPVKPKQLPFDRLMCLRELSNRYIRYCMIYTNMQKCFDHVAHPQKRILIGKVLEAVSGRVVEMRHELERLNISEYVNLVDVCFDKKILVEQLELELSASYNRQKMAMIHQRVILLDFILQTMGEDGTESEIGSNVLCTKGEAVFLIQKNQRAYVARIKADKRRKRMLARRRAGRCSEEEFIQGVILIQSVWRGYLVRRSLSELRKKVAESIGMGQMPDMTHLDIAEKMIQTKDHEKILDNDDEYRKDLIVTTESYLENEGPILEQDLAREIRQWILEYRDIMGTFPQFPTEEEGGSLALYSNKTIEDLEWDMKELQEALEEAAAGKAKKPEKKDEKKDKGKDKKKDEKKKGKGELIEFMMRPSQFIDSDIIPSAQEFGKFWMHKDDFKENPKQTYDRVLLMEEVQKDVEGTIRKQVDQLIRAELEMLEKGIDHIPPAKVKPKKVKEPKAKKKKKVKDLTEGVPIEELYKELVMAGVIKKVPTVALKDFIGAVNLMSPKDSKDMEFTYDLGDVRKMVFDYAILPMSSESVHARAPFIKSLMIVGPHGSGKGMLVQAVCTELGANMFDLSPDNIDGLYEDPESQKRFMQMVMKVGKQMEPSIIYIGNCEQMFTKKLPPEITTRPARLKKELKKALKQITPADRIMLIGTSKLPFRAVMGQLFGMYERMIMVYPPSSKSRYALWNKFITDFKGIMPQPQFQLSPLAYVTKGYTASNIYNACREVLTENRVKRQQKAPLTTKEFVARLSTFDPVFYEEMEEFEKWLLKTPMKKKLAKIEALEEEFGPLADVMVYL